MEIYDIIKQPDSVSSAKENEILKDAIKNYLRSLNYQLWQMSVSEAKAYLLSELNYQERSQLMSCRKYGLTIENGDIAYIDYGKAYQAEIGYQHFGLVLKVFEAKAFVIPMTSNYDAYQNAYDQKTNPEGIKHLMRLGKVDGLYKYSVLFLNDAKFINTARIINVKAHLNTNEELYKKIYLRLLECIQIP